MSAFDNVGSVFGDLGGAVSSLFGAKAAKAQGKSYNEASTIALENVGITRSATALKELTEGLDITRARGAQRAQIGGAGFAESGTALDLLAASATRGALTKAMTEEQGAITANSYAEQAGLYKGLADSANASATGQTLGGILSLASAGFNAYNIGSKLMANPAGGGSSTTLIDTGGAGDVLGTEGGTAVSSIFSEEGAMALFDTAVVEGAAA
jgi:hypothetical protein